MQLRHHMVKIALKPQRERVRLCLKVSAPETLCPNSAAGFYEFQTFVLNRSQKVLCVPLQKSASDA